MGANEKHAATYHGGEYTPTTDELRDIWVDYNLNPLPRSQGISLIETAQADFTRWLESVRDEAKAEALREAAGEFQVNTWASVLTGGIVTRTRNGQEVSDWLRARANQYKENLS